MQRVKVQMYLNKGTNVFASLQPFLGGAVSTGYK